MTAPAPHRPVSSRQSQRQLRRNLRAIGRRCTSLRGVNGFGAVLALLAFVTISLGAAAAVLASAVYDHREDVGRARAPVEDPMSGTAAPLLWDIDGRYVGFEHVPVVFLQHAETADPPLPPGVSALPEPGEAVVSPALRDLLADHGVPDRFGRDIGLIGADGLVSATELFAYVGTDTLAGREPRQLSTFGVADDDPFYHRLGEDHYDRDVQEFWAMAGFLCILPGLIALASAARVADDETRRRHRLLVRIGADRRARARIAAPRTWLAGSISLALCLGALAWITAADTTLPFTGYVLQAEVVRPVAWLIALVIIAAHVIGGAALNRMTAGTLGRKDNLEASRLEVPADQPSWRRTITVFVVLAVQPWIIVFFDNQVVQALSTLAAAGLAVVCLPAALATLLQLIARRRGTTTLQRRGIGVLLGWRITGHRSRAIARLTGTITSLVIVVGHAAVVLALFTAPAEAQNRASEQIGTSALTVRADEDRIRAVLQFASDHHIAAITIHESVQVDDPTVVLGECADLQAFGAECADTTLAPAELPRRLAEVLSSSATSVDIRPASPEKVERSSSGSMLNIVLASHDGTDLPDIELGRDLQRAAGSGTSVERVGINRIAGALDLQNKSQWVYVFGVPGVLTLIIVAALTWAAVVIEESRGLVRNPLLVGRHDVFDSIATVRLAWPIAIGGLGGTAATGWLLAPHTTNNAVSLPVDFLISALLATVVIAAISGNIGGRILAKASRDRW
ncbi:hypothetical protein EF847_12245 [Actinobacteria bacterium YIM 96077]|uniref:ABC transporter permease n=1 Tax=Phytoactinopolyspora halophila TaxID=1981511 RepID=A0A329QYW4_9ACTN|nr:hypothetical protein [Phytoactinopolyspora halophila]AYY13348.1 hypothetical protein EF847_12245 [Actinobacteria bacterium YIM 96077]RAW17417.1 hypothetical protein DPM12_05190 [Phytoactinopolyspora halophila]